MSKRNIYVSNKLSDDNLLFHDLRYIINYMGKEYCELAPFTTILRKKEIQEMANKLRHQLLYMKENNNRACVYPEYERYMSISSEQRTKEIPFKTHEIPYFRLRQIHELFVRMIDDDSAFILVEEEDDE